MTSISSSTSAYISPRQLLQNELLSEVQSGTVSSSDQSALSSALDDIDQSLTSGQKANQSSGPPSQDDLKSKVDDLISGEVSSGKLTSDQADKLKNIFAQTFSDDGGDDSTDVAGIGGSKGGHHGGPHGAHGAGGPPPGPPPSDDSSSSDSSSSTDSTTTLLQDFLKSIQDSQSSSYSSSASATSSSASLSSLLFDYSA